MTEKSSWTKQYTRQANAMMTKTNCPVTAGRATAIHTGRPRQAPVRPKNAWDRLSTNARMSEKIPNSAAIAILPRLSGRPLGRCRRCRLVLQRSGHFGRHVFLVMLGKHLVGNECSRGIDRAMRDDTLPFAEQIRQNAGIYHGNLVCEVGQHEPNL